MDYHVPIDEIPSYTITKPHKNIFLFDIDDNVLSLPTEVKLHISSLKQKHVVLTTAEYAKHGDFIADKLPLYEVRAETSYTNMSDKPDIPAEEQSFVTDIEKVCAMGRDPDGKYAWQAPCWDILRLAVKCEFPVGIITARSHSPETIKAGISVLVKHGFLAHEPNYCGVYPVNNEDVKKDLNADAEGSSLTTPQLKRAAIRCIVEEGGKKYGEEAPHTVWMSDDDQNNVKEILTAFRELKTDIPAYRYYVINSGAAGVINSKIMTEIIIPNQCEQHTIFRDMQSILEELGIYGAKEDRPELQLFRAKDYCANGLISCNAVAGTHCVYLGLSATQAGRRNLLGFAIKKQDFATGEKLWLGRESLTPEGEAANFTVEGLSIRGMRLVQDFQWQDYSAQPGQMYTYTIIPLYTNAHEDETNLSWGEIVACSVRTMSQRMDGSQKNVVCFNRACAGSQAYLRKFGPVDVEDMEPEKKAACLQWLSRGLAENMIKFVELAKDGDFKIRAALYEFSYPPCAKAFGDAIKRGVDCKIIFDANNPEKEPCSLSLVNIANYDLGPVGTTEECPGATAIKRIKVPKMVSFGIHHNKFIILVKAGLPFAVWTGGCNMTISGIFGQSNVGHAIFDEGLAEQFLTYWNRLQHNPPKLPIQMANTEQTPWEMENHDTYFYQPLFSPRLNTDLLYNFNDLLANAASHAPVFITLPFGAGKEIAQSLIKPTPHNKYVLFNKRWISTQQKDNFFKIVKTPRTYVAWGDDLKEDDKLGRWHKEHLSGLSNHVFYVHTKMIIIDPLGIKPMVITGSANFSKSSMVNNDENLVVIRDNPQVAQVYFTEFMRLFTHYKKRNDANFLASKGRSVKTMAMTDKWTAPYFEKNNKKCLHRIAFEGEEPRKRVSRKPSRVRSLPQERTRSHEMGNPREISSGRRRHGAREVPSEFPPREYSAALNERLARGHSALKFPRESSAALAHNVRENSHGTRYSGYRESHYAFPLRESSSAMMGGPLLAPSITGDCSSPQKKQFGL